MASEKGGRAHEGLTRTRTNIFNLFEDVIGARDKLFFFFFFFFFGDVLVSRRDEDGGKGKETEESACVGGWDGGERREGVWEVSQTRKSVKKNATILARGVARLALSARSTRSPLGGRGLVDGLLGGRRLDRGLLDLWGLHAGACLVLAHHVTAKTKRNEKAKNSLHLSH